MDETSLQENLEEGQIIVAEFKVQKSMDWNEARELIRTNAPSSFAVQDVTLREHYSTSGSGSSS